MSERATLVLDFSEEQSSQDCPLMYVEVPEDQAGPGDDVEIRLWGPVEMLGGWTLCVFDRSLGPGRLGTLQEAGYTQQVDLAASLEAQLEYPLTQLNRVTALTPLAYIDAQAPYPPRIWKRQNTVLTAACSRKGYSCLRVDCEHALHGSLEVSYERVASYRSWQWTIPQDYAGDVWFFLYDDVDLEPYRSFAVELPPLASVEEGFRNLSIKTLDFATEAAIPNAAIYLDGAFQGRTDGDGLLHLSDVPTGEHTFKAVCAGYLDSDQDGLSNDTIVVK